MTNTPDKPQPSEDATKAPKELSLDSAKKIVASIGDMDIEKIADEKDFYAFLGPLERRALYLVARSLAKTKDKTDAFAVDKVDGDQRLAMRVYEHQGSPNTLALNLVKDKLPVVDFTLPLNEALIQHLPAEEISFYSIPDHLDARALWREAAGVDRGRLMTLAVGLKWVAQNISTWEQPGIIPVDASKIPY